jgi:hypothetical protein
MIAKVCTQHRTNFEALLRSRNKGYRSGNFILKPSLSRRHSWRGGRGVSREAGADLARLGRHRSATTGAARPDVQSLEIAFDSEFRRKPPRCERHTDPPKLCTDVSTTTAEAGHESDRPHRAQLTRGPRFFTRAIGRRFLPIARRVRLVVVRAARTNGSGASRQLHPLYGKHLGRAVDLRHRRSQIHAQALRRLVVTCEELAVGVGDFPGGKPNVRARWGRAPFVRHDRPASAFRSERLDLRSRAAGRDLLDSATGRSPLVWCTAARHR